MSEPVTQVQFYDEMRAMREWIDAKYVSQREYVGERADKLEAMALDHAKEDRFVEKRVTIIETERTNEKALALKRSTFIGIIAAGSVTAVVEGVKHLMGWK